MMILSTFLVTFLFAVVNCITVSAVIYIALEIRQWRERLLGGKQLSLKIEQI